MDAAICWINTIGDWLEGHNGAITTVATVFMAIFTGLLWNSTKRLWETTEKSIDLARKEFIAGHRPKLIVRRVSLHWNDSLNKITGIEYVVANIGDNPGTIIESNATIHWLDIHPGFVMPGIGFLPAESPYDDDTQSMGNDTFKTGTSAPFIENTDTINDVSLENTRKEHVILLRPQELYFLGYILYKDEVGTIRRTAFCRLYDYRTMRFYAVDDPDYEYAY